MEKLKLNIVPKGARKLAHGSQYDNNRVVRFELFNDLLPYKLTGSETITLIVLRPDNTEIVTSVTNTDDYYIDISITGDMTLIAGVGRGEIRITQGDEIIGSHNFDINIERDPYGETVIIETVEGTIATFNTDIVDNLVEFKGEINPLQDLHGYDYPWSAGAGKNKLPPFISRTVTENGVTFTANDNGIITAVGTPTARANFFHAGDMQGITFAEGEYTISDGYDISTHAGWFLEIVLIQNGNLNYYSTTGVNHFTFSNGDVVQSIYISIFVEAGNVNLTIKPMIRLSSVSDPTFEPYSNICEISGFTEANIANTGVDEIRELFTIDPSFRGHINFNQKVNKNIIMSSGSRNGLTITNNNDGSLSFSGTATSNDWILLINSYIPSQENHKYLIDINTNNTLRISDGYFHKKIVNWTHGSETIGLYVRPQTNTAYNERLYIVCIDLTQLFGEEIADYIYNLEESQAGAGLSFFKAIYPLDYYAYNAGQDKIVGDIIPVTISLGGTIYGGLLTCIAGKWRLKTTYGVIDLGSLSWIYTSGNNSRFETTTPLPNVKVVAGNIIPNALCLMFKIESMNNVYLHSKDNIIGYDSYVWIYDSNAGTDPNAFKTAMNGVNLVYELANPIEIELTGDQVETLLGNNNIFIDTNGAVEVKFYKSSEG